MSARNKRDVARQAANVVAALFQVGATVAASAKIQEVVDEGPPSLVEPAGYAFAIWALIFALSLVYAVYQMLPANHDKELLRRIGPFTAGAFACTGLWSIFVPERQFVLAQAMLQTIFACLAVAYIRLARDARGRVLSGGERWLVALSLGPFFGWITATNAVSLTSEADRLGVVGSGGAGETLLGAALLLLGGLLAAAVVLAGKDGPPQGYLAYAATVLWAFIGVVANQHEASLVTTGAAIVAAGPIVLVLFGVLRGAGRVERRVGPRDPEPPEVGRPRRRKARHSEPERPEAPVSLKHTALAALFGKAWGSMPDDPQTRPLGL